MIEGLSEKGAKVFNFLIKGVREGLSGRQVLEALRSQGLGYRMSDFYRDFRLVKAAEGKWDTMKWTPHDRFIPEEYYKKAKAPLRANYMTTVKIRALDKETGEVKDRFVSIFHDRPKTREELEEEAINLMQSESEELEPIEAMPVKALASPVKWVV